MYSYKYFWVKYWALPSISWDCCYRFSIHLENLKLGWIQEHFLCWPHGWIPSFNWALIEADYMAVRGRSGSKNIRLIVSTPLDGLGNTDISYSHLSQVRCHSESKPDGTETGVHIKVFHKWNSTFLLLLDKTKSFLTLIYFRTLQVLFLVPFIYEFPLFSRVFFHFKGVTVFHCVTFIFIMFYGLNVGLRKISRLNVWVFIQGTLLNACWSSI